MAPLDSPALPCAGIIKSNDKQNDTAADHCEHTVNFMNAKNGKLHPKDPRQPPPLVAARSVLLQAGIWRLQ
jgi:hypothetical protein